MKILLTGATGFVGKNLIQELVKIPGTQILTVGRNPEKARDFFPGMCNVEHTDLNAGAIRKFAPEIVIHLASFLTSKNDTETMEKILDANIAFGTRLLDTLKNCTEGTLKFFVNAGTFAEYRFGAGTPKSAYLYSAAKTAFRAFVDYYAELIGFRWIHVAPYTIFGGNDTQKKVIDVVTDSFSSSVPVKMSGGDQILDFIHIDDVVSFFVFTVRNPERFSGFRNGEVFHLGTGRGTSIRELAGTLENRFGRKANIAWGALPYREMDVMHAVAPVGKLLALGWKPKNTF